MAVYKADAIVIRSREYGEADRLLTLFSREQGKLEAIAKGVRKPKSTQRGGSQLFTYGDFLLYQGKSLDTISQAHPRESFSHLWDDFDRSVAASSMVELLDISTIRQQPEPRLFFLTLHFLFLLKEVDPYLAQAAYALRLMDIQGYLPALEKEQNLPFVKTLTPGSLALMKQLHLCEPGILGRLRWGRKTRAEILEGLCTFCEGRIERKLQAWRQGREFWGK